MDCDFMKQLRITSGHEGANINVVAILENMFQGPATAEELRVATEKELSLHINKVLLTRDQHGCGCWWHYWNFCVENACNKIINFEFMDGLAVGPFGVAVSHDLKNWVWSGAETIISEREFRYEFSSADTKVYFCIYPAYLSGNWHDFLRRYDLKTQTLCKSEKNRDVELLKIGNGHAKKHIVFTSRHHACETGASYVLEGVLSQMMEDKSDFLKKYNISVIPFVDIDGVVEGEQGNFRSPNYNRAYLAEPVYNATKGIVKYLKGKKVVLSIDFHSPKLYGTMNDPMFFFIREDPIASRTKKLCRIFEKNITGECFNYRTKDDEMPGIGYNVSRAATCTGYMISTFSPNIAVTLEVPYFGMPDNQATPARLVNNGRALGKSIIDYCAKYLAD